jgi:uncharacterized protein YgiM (DUF1202 family)
MIKTEGFMRSIFHISRWVFAWLIILGLTLAACSSAPGATATSPAPTETLSQSATDTAEPPTPVPSATITPTATPPHKAVVTAQSLNLRAGPATTFDVVIRVNKDDVLSVIGRNSDYTWIYVQTSDGKNGWVYASYVTMDASIQTFPAAPEPTKKP